MDASIMASLEFYSTRTLFLLVGGMARGGGTRDFFSGKKEMPDLFRFGSGYDG